jgi:pyruvate/2-oxoglutarate dehydrogenase complex dihydrolipoamide dehydrogenase (E3) component
VVDRKGRILGASIAGAGAGEMINIFALAWPTR